MDSSELLQQGNGYFSYRTSDEVSRNFIRNMYLYLFKRALFIHTALYIPSFNYGGLFFNSLLSGGLFVISVYMLLVLTALLYSNFDSISEDDIFPYSYLLTVCFSYIFTYLTNLYDTQFYILNTHYLTFLFGSIFIYTNQITYSYNYNNVIKISLSSQFLVFLVLSMIYNNFQYILFTYLTSSLSSLYIVYNTENMITNEEKKFRVKTDEYLTGSVLLYLDLFNIFPYIKKKMTEII